MKLVCLLKLTNHGKTLWEGLSINQMHWELQQLLVCGLRYNCKNPCTSHITTYTELVIVIPVSTYTGSLRTGSRLEPSVIQGERDEPRVVWWGGSVRSTRFARGVTTLRLARRIFFPSSLGACSQAIILVYYRPLVSHFVSLYMLNSVLAAVRSVQEKKKYAS